MDKFLETVVKLVILSALVATTPLETLILSQVIDDWRAAFN